MKTDIGQILQEYQLPDDVLPLAHCRFPFASYDKADLDRAAHFVLRFPEKRGMLSHAVRQILGHPQPKISGSTLTLEAHFDSVDVPKKLRDQLLLLGFEDDGFHKFVPKHFREHHTLKLKVALNALTRRGELRQFISQSCRNLVICLEENHPELECYIEYEIYPSRNRITWKQDALYSDWNNICFPNIRFELIDTDIDGAVERYPDGLIKRADIHAKLSPFLSMKERESIVLWFEGFNFYDVQTWAGNTVCTGQFLHPGEARDMFELITAHAMRSGGLAELTLEPAPWFWRSRFDDGQTKKWSEIPPLIRRVPVAGHGSS